MVPGGEDQARPRGRAEAPVAAEVQRQEFQVAALIAHLLDHLPVGLRWHDHQHSCDERQAQSRQPAAEPPPGPAAQRNRCHGAGDQEQQAHAPRVDEPHPGLESGAGRGALEVPVPAHVVHAHVISDEKPKGEKPQGVQERQAGVGPKRRVCGGRAGSWCHLSLPRDGSAAPSAARPRRSRAAARVRHDGPCAPRGRAS